MKRPTLMTVGKDKKTDREEAYRPAQLLEVELSTFRKRARKTLKAYSRKLETGVVEVELSVQQISTQEKRQDDVRTRDIRDMLTVLRRLNIKPEKGRCRDLKKLEAAVEDLQSLLKNW